MSFGGTQGLAPPPQIAAELEPYFAQVLSEIRKASEVAVSPSALSGLTDTSISSPVARHFLVHNGSAWVNRAIEIDDLPGGLVVTDVTDLGDVTLTSLADEDFFVYDTGTSMWRNRKLVAADVPSLAASIITSGTFDDARIAESSVTQHETALTITEPQITDGSTLARMASNEVITGTWQFDQPIKINSYGALDYSAYHEAVLLSANLVYDAGGAGATDPNLGDNWTYQRAAGANNAAGWVLLGKGNGAESGMYLRFLTAPTSTGAGARLGSSDLTSRMTLSSAGLSVSAATVSGTLTATLLTLGTDTTGADASIWQSATGGLTLRGIAGSSYDFQLVNAGGGTAIMRVPTGTDDVEFADDILLGSGAVIRFSGGDVTITHSANTLTVDGGALVAAGGISGLLTGGTWAGDVITEEFGGTGYGGTYVEGELLYGDSGGGLSRTGGGTTSDYLRGGTTPSWQSLSTAVNTLVDANRNITSIWTFTTGELRIADTGDFLIEEFTGEKTGVAGYVSFWFNASDSGTPYYKLGSGGTPYRLARVNAAETISSAWTFSGSPVFSGSPSFTGTPSFSGVATFTAIPNLYTAGTSQFDGMSLQWQVAETAGSSISLYRGRIEKDTAGAATGNADWFLRAYTKTNAHWLTLFGADASAQEIKFLWNDSGTDAAIQKESWVVRIGSDLQITYPGVLLGGEWQGEVIDEVYGGTGFGGSYEEGAILYGDSTGGLSRTIAGTTSDYLRGGSTPSWQNLGTAIDARINTGRTISSTWQWATGGQLRINDDADFLIEEYAGTKTGVAGYVSFWFNASASGTPYYKLGTGGTAYRLARTNAAETISSAWTFSGNPVFSGAPNFTGTPTFGSASHSGTITSTVAVGNNMLSWGSGGGGMQRITTQGGLGVFCDSSLLLHAGDNFVALKTDIGIAAASTFENIYIVADGNVYIRANRQSTYAASYGWAFSTGGVTTFPGGGTVSSASEIQAMTWMGTPIGATYGGLGSIGSIDAGDMLYATGANTWGLLSAGATSQYLRGGTTPSWQSLTTAVDNIINTSRNLTTAWQWTAGSVRIFDTADFLVEGFTGEKTGVAGFYSLWWDDSDFGTLRYKLGTGGTVYRLARVNGNESVSQLWAFTNGLNVTGTFAVTGDITATGDVASDASDERLKDILEDVDGEKALDFVRSASKVIYRWNDVGEDECDCASFKDKAPRLGLIAQDVHAAYPQATYIAPFDRLDGKSRSGKNYLGYSERMVQVIVMAAIEELAWRVESVEDLVASVMERLG